jgi:hypothetical protein
MEEGISILDNFLPVEEFNKLEGLLFSYGFPWFFMDSIGTAQDTNRFFMCHGFMEGAEPASPYLEILDPIISKLPNVTKLLRVKANLYYPTPSVEMHAMHVDYSFPHRGALLFMNSNNGYTRIGGDKVLSVANRLVLFNPGVPHSSSSCTDSKYRSTLIFNYL